MASTAISPEERQARVSALLRQVDEDVKARSFDAALEKVRKVYEFDIKNIYARAYEERILAMKVEKERDEALREVEKKASEKADEEVKRRLKEFYRQQELETQKRRQQEKQEQDLEERARKASVNEAQQVATKDLSAIEKESIRRIEELEKRLIAQLAASAPKASSSASSSAVEQVRAEYEAKLQQLRNQYESAEAERKKIQEETFRKLQEEQKRAQEDLVLHFEEERDGALQRAAEKEKERALETYRSVMFLMMQLQTSPDILTPVLQSLKISFAISDADHMEVERAVQVNAYIEAVRMVWGKGKPSEDDLLNLKNIQHFYRVPDDEHAMITKRIKKDLGLPDESAVIYVIDDDPSIRKYAEHILKKTYHTVVTAVNAESALPSLAATKPSLILSDINLGAGVMSGFTLYEKLRVGTYGEELARIPFILMSAMEDEFFIRTAKQMGVRAYLAKPFSKDVLESTIRAALG